MSAATVITNGDLSVELLPERGLDIGITEWQGHSVQWSRVPSIVRSHDWVSAWPGGLVTTCGLNNVGTPSEGYGLHGCFALTAAVDVDTRLHPDGSADARGKIVDGALVCERTVSVVAAGRLHIDDNVTNTSVHPVQAPLLYHVNFGAPFFDSELEVIAEVERTVARDDASNLMTGDWRWPSSVQHEHEVVVEHFFTSGAQQSVVLVNQAMGLRVTVGWHGLHRLHQWIDLAEDRYVTAIEPANCSVLGREADRHLGTAPFLAAGESRTTGLTIEVTNA